MAQGPRQVTKNRLLWVEGRDEQNLIEGLLKHLDISSLDVFDIAGETNFVARGQAVLAQARSMGITLISVGIIRDANDNSSQAFKRALSDLERLNLARPSQPSEFTQGNLSVGVFISPDGQSPGSIETLCWNSIEGTEQAACVQEFIQCLRDKNALESSNEWKTRTHAFLASKADPVARVGEGALKGYWGFESPAFDGLRVFLRTLAGQ
ncbi:MAG: hypothetical protein HY671_10230 [Chloroflexi bacterium]|nr:hypothetical protein [Chloroflexota bacterium]